LDALQEPGCPLSCKDNPKSPPTFDGAPEAWSFEESGREWCSAVRGLDPDERKSPTLITHSGQVMTYGYNTNHRATNVRVQGTGTEIFSYTEEGGKIS
jgi:hypothetical protein